MKINLQKAGVIAGAVAGMLTSYRLGLLIKDKAYEKVLDEKDGMIKDHINQVEQCLDLLEWYGERNDKLEKTIDELLKLIKITGGSYTEKELDEISEAIKKLKQIYNI